VNDDLAWRGAPLARPAQAHPWGASAKPSMVLQSLTRGAPPPTKVLHCAVRSYALTCKWGKEGRKEERKKEKARRRELLFPSPVWGRGVRGEGE